MRAATAGAAKSLTVLSLIMLVFGGTTGCRTNSLRPSIPADTKSVNGGASDHDTLLHPSTAPGSAVALRRLQIILKQAGRTLDSHRAFHEVEIPLLFKGHLPYVQARWSGRQVACLLDTGADTILWPERLHLDTRRLDITRIQRWSSGESTRSEWMFTPRITIGGLVLTNVPTEAILSSNPSAAGRVTLREPIIGMEALNAFVITVDCRQRRLILRDADYDVTRLPHAAHSLLIHYVATDPTRVALPGTLAGINATFLLDTGSDGMYVSSPFAQRVLNHARKQPASGTELPTSLRNVSGTVGGMHFKATTLRIIGPFGGPDVDVGANLFGRYRVTMDRFRGVVLMERQVK